MRRVLKILLIVPLAYLLLVGGFFVAMHQTPDVFSSVMAKTPSVVFPVLPFRQMWLRARKGKLRVGDGAPDFSLETYDGKSRVQLSDFRGSKSVVLVFGSYT
jgi:hypothetical protein